MFWFYSLSSPRSLSVPWGILPPFPGPPEGMWWERGWPWAGLCTLVILVVCASLLVSSSLPGPALSCVHLWAQSSVCLQKAHVCMFRTEESPAGWRVAVTGRHGWRDLVGPCLPQALGWYSEENKASMKSGQRLLLSQGPHKSRRHTPTFLTSGESVGSRQHALASLDEMQASQLWLDWRTLVFFATFSWLQN